LSCSGSQLRPGGFKMAVPSGDNAKAHAWMAPRRQFRWSPLSSFPSTSSSGGGLDWGKFPPRGGGIQEGRLVEGIL
jgi:hypothetical protein